jgi:hypothetical protein
VKGKYSIVEIGTWSWVRAWRFARFTEDDMGQFPHLLELIARVPVRPAVQHGISEICECDSKALIMWYRQRNKVGSHDTPFSAVKCFSKVYVAPWVQQGIFNCYS